MQRHGPFTWAVRGAVADMEDFTKKDAAFTIKNGGFVGFCASNMMIPSDFGDLTNKMAGLSIQNGDLTSKLRDRTGISLDAEMSQQQFGIEQQRCGSKQGQW